jgi:hypothetical protein
MKTVKLTSVIATLNLVFFMSIASLANTGTSNSGDLTKSDNKNLSNLNSSEKDYSYLRFDVNKYVNENESAEMNTGSFDYLRFNVESFVTENETGTMELPVANEFEYLRFDVNNFTETYAGSTTELPVDEFEYLRFDVNKYTAAGNNTMEELPLLN